VIYDYPYMKISYITNIKFFKNMSAEIIDIAGRSTLIDFGFDFMDYDNYEKIKEIISERLDISIEMFNYEIIGDIINIITNELSDHLSKYPRLIDISLSDAKPDMFLFSDDIEEVRLGIILGAKIEYKGGISLCDRTPLLNAIANNNLEIVKLLDSRGANVFAEDGYHKSVALLAAETDNIEIMRYLLEKHQHLDINLSDYENETPYRIAMHNENYEMMQLLEKNGAELSHGDIIESRYLYSLN